jgi:hypothetical protein
VSSLRSCDPLAYFDNEHAKQLLYALYDHIWGMKITALEESTDFVTLDTEKLFSKLKSHELFRKGHPNHDVSLTSKALITIARIGGHDNNPIKTTISSALEFVLSFLAAASDEQYESIIEDKISSAPCTSFVRRGGDHLEAVSSVVTPPTSSLTVPRRRSSSPPTSMTTSSRTTTAWATIRRSTASGTRRRRRSSRRSCPERVLPSATSTSPLMTSPAQRRMRRSSVSKATSPAIVSWVCLQKISLTPM